MFVFVFIHIDLHIISNFALLKRLNADWRSERGHQQLKPYWSVQGHSVHIDKSHILCKFQYSRFSEPWLAEGKHAKTSFSDSHPYKLLPTSRNACSSLSSELQNMKSYFKILSPPVWFHYMLSLVSLVFQGAAFEQRSYSYFRKLALLVRQSWLAKCKLLIWGGKRNLFIWTTSFFTSSCVPFSTYTCTHSSV